MKSKNNDGNKKNDRKNSRIEGKNELIEKFLRFQATGAGFDIAWAGVGPIVEEIARVALKKLHIKVWTAYGEWAVDDVGSMTKLRLLELGQPGANGRFDPAKTKAAGLSGFKGWLWRVVYRMAVDWARENCNVGDKKLFLESDLEWNDATDDGANESFLHQQPAKIRRAALLPILEEVIGHLTDPLMRQAVRLKLDEDLSQEETGRRLGVSDTTIGRRLQAAYAILQPLLEARGIDGSWLAA